ncbi:hypothetical protein M8C21_015377 [Ambrosia artemisiifolia]|uniref:Uncharacterized protein n=1 Tax=Ambrosia artemisiifolia TaxID=4212 RepID=A0AAD5C107_AMBAR|nr:hypothetical protein M8C21_015377 [Ambrosia artemisiifolia]
MATALSSVFDEIKPPDKPKSLGVEERWLTVHRISEDNLVSGNCFANLDGKSNEPSTSGSCGSLEVSLLSIVGALALLSIDMNFWLFDVTTSASLDDKGAMSLLPG